MNLTDALDLLSALLAILAIAWFVFILVPAPWCWPAALGLAAGLVTVLSVSITKRGAR
jgi:hypothetical protein